MDKKYQILLAFGFILGLLIILQGRAYFHMEESLARDSLRNIFQEIKILKDKNSDLKNTVSDLTTTLEQLSDQDTALKSIAEDMKKYKKLTGDYQIFGSGIELTIDQPIQAPYMVDFINELFNAGAYAVSVNGIRLTNSTKGIDSSPIGQLFINSTLLSPPYILNAIGEPKNMIDIINVQGGIVDRTKKKYPGISVYISSKEVIKMD